MPWSPRISTQRARDARILIVAVMETVQALFRCAAGYRRYFRFNVENCGWFVREGSFSALSQKEDWKAHQKVLVAGESIVSKEREYVEKKVLYERNTKQGGSCLSSTS